MSDDAATVTFYADNRQDWALRGLQNVIEALGPGDGTPLEEGDPVTIWPVKVHMDGQEDREILVVVRDSDGLTWVGGRTDDTR